MMPMVSLATHHRLELRPLRLLLATLWMLLSTLCGVLLPYAMAHLLEGFAAWRTTVGDTGARPGASAEGLSAFSVQHAVLTCVVIAIASWGANAGDHQVRRSGRELCSGDRLNAWASWPGLCA